MLVRLAPVTLACALALSGCGDGGPPANPPPSDAGAESSAEGGPGREEPSPTHRGHLGVLVARDAVDVAAEVSGRVREVLVRPGDAVARGDLLARLDTRETEQDLTMARASLDALLAEVTRAQRQLQEARTRHQRRLRVPETFSREELEATALETETAEAAYEAARAREAEQRARVAQLRDVVSRTALRAPFDGTVALRYRDAGSTVTPGAPVVRLITSSELLVRFAIPPEAEGRFAAGTPVRVRLEASGDTVEGTGPEVTAEVVQVAPEIDSASRMIFVEARLRPASTAPGAAEAPPLRAGLVARIFPTVS